MTGVEPQVLVFRHGPIANLSYVVACPYTREALAIDPAWDVPGMLAAMASNGFSLRAIALSHGHHDHLNGIAELAAATGASVFAHEAEDISELRSEFAGSVLGLRHEELLPIGALHVRALHTPGHTDGSLSLLAGRDLFTGDAMMVAGMGRPGPGLKRVEAMWRTVTEVFGGLADDVRIRPGHDAGPELAMTLEEHRRRVPAMRAESFDEFLTAMEKETGRILRPR